MTGSRIVVAAVLSSATIFCAKAYPPPGGEPDKLAPEVVETVPARLATVPQFDDAVIFRFNERISERGIEEAVMVSPETGHIEVSRGRSEVRVRVAGGWKPGLVYRVVLLPTIRDLFGNQRKEPVDMVFSTGPVIPNTAVAGLLTSRLTGKPLPEARVEAISRIDSVLYATVTDTAGFFALRYIPLGTYSLHAYHDQNRDKRTQMSEAQSDSVVQLATAADTVVLEMTLLARDTTPARLLRAEARDSMQVRLTLDDYVDPTRGVLGEVALYQLPDSTEVQLTRLWAPRAFDAMRAAARIAAGDTTRAAARDTARTPPTQSARLGGGPATPGVAGAADTVALATQELVLVPGRPLLPRTRYRVIMSGVVNINDIPGGSGNIVFETAAPPPAPPAPAARDSARGVQPPGVDTTTSPPRTQTPPVRVVPDTARSQR